MLLYSFMIDEVRSRSVVVWLLILDISFACKSFDSLSFAIFAKLCPVDLNFSSGARSCLYSFSFSSLSYLSSLVEIEIKSINIIILYAEMR